MPVTVTNRCGFRVMSVYGAGGTAPSGFGILLLGGTTPGSGTLTAAVIKDINTVSELLAVANVDEVVATNYARASLASIVASEDDSADRGALDAANVVFASLGGATNDTIKGAALYEAGANDGARLVISVVTDLNIPTNGSDVTVTIADFLRATPA